MNKDFMDYLSRRLVGGACKACAEFDNGGPSSKSDECKKCYMSENEPIPSECDE